MSFQSQPLKTKVHEVRLFLAAVISTHLADGNPNKAAVVQDYLDTLDQLQNKAGL